jgi:two-component system, LytTR family, response regulator
VGEDMLNIAICDDDENIIRKIENFIKEYDDEECKITTYSCGEDLLKERKAFNVIFLDIDMGGLNGIETARQIRNYDKGVKIIYATNFTDYVNLAFEVHAFGYLNKPVKREQIHKQLSEVIAYAEEKKEQESIEFLTTEGVVRMAPRDIYYFEYINRRVKIKTLDSTYVIKEKITTIAENMNKYGFLMPHKSFTVNLFYVKAIKGYDISMVDGSVIPLSQKKSAEFRDQFNIFLEKHI